MEEKKINFLDFDKDVDLIASQIDWIEDETQRRNLVIGFLRRQSKKLILKEPVQDPAPFICLK